MTALHRADSLHSRLVRHRDCHHCQYAKSSDVHVDCWGQLEAAHIVPRRHRHTRWMLSNAVTLCSSHHGYFTEHPEAWDRWVRDRYGDAVIDALWTLARHTDKPPRAEDAVKRLRQLATNTGIRP